MAIQNEPAKLRWGELEEDDGDDLDFLLPPREVIGPDENGIKKVIEYEFDEDGGMVKITRTTRIRKVRLSKRVVERRSWPKFGDAVHKDVGRCHTMVSTKEFVLRIPEPFQPFGPSKADEDYCEPLPPCAVLIECRICGGDHWTSRCPYKSEILPPTAPAKCTYVPLA